MSKQIYGQTFYLFPFHLNRLCLNRPRTIRFGLPLLEAVASGTLIIAGKNSSMPEVVRKTGMLVDADDISSIAMAFRGVGD